MIYQNLNQKFNIDLDLALICLLSINFLLFSLRKIPMTILKSFSSKRWGDMALSFKHMVLLMFIKLPNTIAI